MKKIAWITTGAFIDTDYYILKAIREHYEINVYILKRKCEVIDFVTELSKIKNSLFTVEVIDIGNRYRDLPNLRRYIQLFKKIKNSGYDLLYTTLSNPPYFIPALKTIMDGKKIIMAIHNVHVPKGGTKYYFNKIYNRFTIKSFYNFQTFSQTQCEYLKKQIPNKNVNYSPFFLKDYGQIITKSKHEMITFLTFGNIRTYKRIDVLIDAAQKAYERSNKKFKVIIAGDCPNWSEYEKLIRIPNLFDIRIGRIDSKDIPSIFSEADYFVAPYQDIAQSGSIIVAVNYDIPIIASRLPSFEEVVSNGENGFLIKPADSEELTEVILYILDNHLTIYDSLVENQKINKKENYSNEAITKNYINYFDRVGEKNAEIS